MLDKAGVRALNRLIRQPTRKRLAAPAQRAAIGAGAGLASAGDDVEVLGPEGIYVSLVGGGPYEDVYFFAADGSAPQLIGAGYGGLGIGVYDDDVFSVSHLGYIYKNGSSINSVTHTNISLLACNATNIIIEDYDSSPSQYYAYICDYTGSVLSTLNLPTAYLGSAILAANDDIIVYIDNGDQIRISDFSGALLGYDNLTNISNADNAACNKYCCAFVDADSALSPTTYYVKIYNNSGAKIGQHNISIASLLADIGGYDLACIGLSENHIYFVGASTTAPKVAIYEHTLTISGGVATSATLGSQVALVATGQGDNSSYSYRFEYCAMDCARW